jgi:hypothetical protein
MASNKAVPLSDSPTSSEVTKMYDRDQARLEQLLASAHQAVWKAGTHAAAMDRPELAWELERCCVEIAGMMEDQLSAHPGRKERRRDEMRAAGRETR